MRNIFLLSVSLFVCTWSVAWADTFGTGDNQFSIDFVNIFGDAGFANETLLTGGFRFRDPAGVYRISVYEITNGQWAKFTAGYGVPYGSPISAYDDSYFDSELKWPIHASWYEAAQFVNWLNISTGHPTAYKFTGTQGQSDYSFVPWEVGDSGYNASNPYRNSRAFYFLPTVDEWVKAAYWNGSVLQNYATRAGDTLHQGDGVSGTGWNYFEEPPYGTFFAVGPWPWDVGSGSEELNGTYDMMGNVWEWMESPRFDEEYLSGSFRGVLGGSWGDYQFEMSALSGRSYDNPDPGIENEIGFRIASVVPEPGTILLIGLGGVFLKARKKS